MTYPAATLFVRNNKYYVSVTIPIELRPAFGNGNSTNKRFSTGTSDKDLAQLKLHELAAEIYKLFDGDAAFKTSWMQSMQRMIGE